MKQDATKAANAAANVHTVKVEGVGQIPLADDAATEHAAPHGGHG